jgi:hypothetical protein
MELSRCSLAVVRCAVTASALLLLLLQVLVWPVVLLLPGPQSITRHPENNAVNKINHFVNDAVSAQLCL